MVFTRFYDDKLAQASFLIGCKSTREAIIIDPNRDVSQYIDEAAKEGLRIAAVTETHIHADFVSGARELAASTGATLYLSDEGDADWKYAFATEENAVLIKDGSQIQVGKVSLDVMKTPGHTPEHVTFIVTDLAVSDKPLGAFTGDFVFVGDVGRPDLLEKAAGFQGTMEAGAKTLFASLERFKAAMPDSLVIWPSHGAGSACGKALGGVPVSSLGYEKIANWGLRAATEAEFVREVLTAQPEPPVYFKHMKRINKEGPAILGGFMTPSRIPAGEIEDVMGSGMSVVDIRSTAEFMNASIPGALHIPGDQSFTTWAGWMLPYDNPIVLFAQDEDQARQATRDLAMIGLDDVVGWIGPDALLAWQLRGKELNRFRQLGAQESLEAAGAGKATILDVRGQSEYETAHVAGAVHIPLGYLNGRIDEVPKDKPVIVMCGGGTRSPVGVSVLARHGFESPANMADGMWEVRKLGLPFETGP